MSNKSKVGYSASPTATAEQRGRRKTWLWVLGWLLAPFITAFVYLRRRGFGTRAGRFVCAAFAYASTAFVIAVAVAACAGSPTESATGAASEQPAEAASSEDAAVNDRSGSDPNEPIVLVKGTTGQYGHEVLADVRFEGIQRDVAYSVPAGTYTTKNCGVYPVILEEHDEIVPEGGGTPELDLEGFPRLCSLESGETQEFVVQEGKVLAIPTYAGHVVLIPEGSSFSPGDFGVDDDVNVLQAFDAEMRDYCHKLVADTYGDCDVNWDPGSWGWKFSLWHDGTIDANLDVPTADGTGYLHSVWVLFTPTIEGGSMTGATCHFVSFDYIGRYTGDDVPESHVFDDMGERYRQRLDAVVLEALGG